MLSLKEKLDESCRCLTEIFKTHDFPVPKVAVMLGSGSQGFVESIDQRFSIPIENVAHMVAPRVLGHGTSIECGYVSNIPCAIFSGRIHYYEGYDISTVVYNVRVMGRLGVKNLVLTNAAGGLHTGVKPGQIAVIKDHINLMGINCLVGEQVHELGGPRFVSLEDAYSWGWRARLNKRNPNIFQVVYAGLSGPSYETAAETRYLATIGADVAGMSTVQETLAAKHLGMNVMGISLITNYCGGIGEEGKISHDRVLQIGKQYARDIQQFLTQVIECSE